MIAAAPVPRLLLVAGGVACVVGVALIAIQGGSWLDALGFLFAIAGAAALIASSRSIEGASETDRRLLLALALFLVMSAAGVFLWFQDSTPSATLEVTAPSPGKPLLLTSIGAGKIESAGHGPAFLEAELGSFEITEIEGPLPAGSEPGTRTFELRIPVSRSDCPKLETNVGGRCGGDAGKPLSHAVSVEAKAAQHSIPLTVDLRPLEAAVLELTDASQRTDEAVPNSWGVREDAPRTEVVVGCFGSTLEVRALGEPVRVSCAPPTSTYRLAVDVDPNLLATVGLSDLDQLTVRSSADRAEATVDEASFSLSGAEQSLPSPPTTVAIEATNGNQVSLDLNQAKKTDLNQIELHTDAASEASTNGDNRVPNWLAGHPELAFFLLGILAAILVPAVFDFALVKRTRKQSR